MRSQQIQWTIAIMHTSANEYYSNKKKHGFIEVPYCVFLLYHYEISGDQEICIHVLGGGGGATSYILSGVSVPQ